MEFKKLLVDKIDHAARMLYRQNNSDKYSILSVNSVINSLLAGSLIAAGILIWSKFQDSQHSPVLEVAPSRWSVVIGKSDESCWGPLRKTDCMASPDNKELWTSDLHRRDEEYYKRLNADLKHTIWLGLKLSPEELKRANSSNASRLMLGTVNSRYEVYVDGERIQVGDYSENNLPISLDLTAERLQNEKPLYVAIAVFRSGKIRTIDSDGFVPTMGFYTSRAADQQIRWVIFAHDSRYYISFVIFLLFGIIFRHGSLTKNSNVEYPAASVLSFVVAFLQFVVADSTYRALGAGLYYPVLNSILISEVCAVIGFGLAFSRSRNSFIKFFHLAVPVVFVVVLIMSFLFNEDGRSTELIITFMTPLSYFITGSLCLLQLFSLKLNRDYIDSSPKRRVLLGAMGLIFVTIAISFVIQSMRAQTSETHWIRVLALIPLYIISKTMASAVRQNYRIIETTSISAFHKMTNLPDSVSGVIINLDLKASERLFRTGAQEDVGGTIVSTLLSHIWNKFTATGATVMQSSGDDLMLLYPENSLKENSLIWLETLISVHEELQLIAKQFADTQPELATLKSIEYRAAVSRGSVRPLWRVIGTTRVPAWVEAGAKNVFVDTARLLEISRSGSIPEAADRGSVVMIDESLEADIEAIKDLKFSGFAAKGKHGHIYRGKILALKAHLNHT